MRTVKKKRVGYVRSKLERTEGYLLRHLENKTFPNVAIIPKPGLAGNRRGLQVCISRAERRDRADGHELDARWERQRFAVEKGKLYWHRCHTEITTSATGRMLKQQVVDETPQGWLDLGDGSAELVLLGDRVFEGRQHAMQVSNKTGSVYFAAENLVDAELWADTIQDAIAARTAPEDMAATLAARSMAHRARKPVCVVSGATAGPWQMLRPGLTVAAPGRSIGDRVRRDIYYADKKLRHKQIQYQADEPGNRKYGMVRRMPSSFATEMPPALADSPMGRVVQHSLSRALQFSGI